MQTVVSFTTITKMLCKQLSVPQSKIMILILLIFCIPFIKQKYIIWKKINVRLGMAVRGGLEAIHSKTNLIFSFFSSSMFT